MSNEDQKTPDEMNEEYVDATEEIEKLNHHTEQVQKAYKAKAMVKIELASAQDAVKEIKKRLDAADSHLDDIIARGPNAERQHELDLSAA